MLRLLLLALFVLAAVVAVEARWNGDSRALQLRLRDEKEIAGLLRDRALDLGERALRAARDVALREREAGESEGEPSTPAVGAPARSAAGDQLTDEDRRELDRLIEEKTRESRNRSPARAD
ncbi:MAG: hypothetical protein ACE5FG_14765 [Myxococcota bacterium]